MIDWLTASPIPVPLPGSLVVKDRTARPHLRRHARPGIGEGDARKALVVDVSELGDYPQRSAVGVHRIKCVDREVYEHLLSLSRRTRR